MRRSGLQFDTTVNSWHPCPTRDASTRPNPCSEYMFLDDSACNLASLNLRKFQFPIGHPPTPVTSMSSRSSARSI